MKLKHVLPFLALVPIVCTSCGSYYEVEALYVTSDMTKILQVSFTETIEFPLTSVCTTVPSFDGYWVEWIDDLQIDQFRLGGNLVGKTISKIAIDPDDVHTIRITLTGDCTASYRENHYGIIAVDRTAFTIKNHEYDAVTSFLCMVVTGKENALIDRDWNIEP